MSRLRGTAGLGEVRYLPEGAPSDALRWAAANPAACRSASVAMVGNIYPTRVRFLEKLVDEVQVDIYGRLHNDAVPEAIRRNFTGQFLSGRDKYEVFRDARGVLNNLHFAEVESVNYRLFEAAACRGVVLVDEVPQVARFLQPGVEALTFRTAEDLVGVLRELSDHDFDEIGSAAHDRVVRDHQIKHRLDEMLVDLEHR